MKLIIDTKSKTITLKETIKLKDLLEFIEILPGKVEDWKINQEAKFETITIKDNSDWYKPYNPLGEVMYGYCNSLLENK